MSYARIAATGLFSLAAHDFEPGSHRLAVPLQMTESMTAGSRRPGGAATLSADVSASGPNSAFDDAELAQESFDLFIQNQAIVTYEDQAGIATVVTMSRCK